MHRIVTLEAGALIANVRRPAFVHDWVEFDATGQDEVAERLADATIAIVNKRLLTAGIIAGLPQLQMVAIAATGYNNIDLEACRARGIVVSNVRGYARETVPEHVFALLLALSRQIGPSTARWRPDAGSEASNSAISITPSATWPARPWAFSAAAPWATASPASPRPSACG
jgi:lactate dehydrogenase-like 2-hydroxyacid dehydrogenase